MHRSPKAGLRTAIFSGKSVRRMRLLLSSALLTLTLMSGHAMAALAAAYDAELSENRSGHDLTAQLRIAW